MAETTDLIAMSINQEKPLFGIDLKYYVENEYKSLFRTKLEKFIFEQSIKISNKEQCDMRTQTR